MSVIVSRYVSKCTVCGVRIPVGSRVNWARKVAGVSHADGCVPVTFEARSAANDATVARSAREDARVNFEEDTKVLNKAGKWVGIIAEVKAPAKVLDPAYGPTNGLNGLPPQYLPTVSPEAVKRAAAFRWNKPVAPKCTRNPCKGCNVCNEDGDGSESETPDIAF